MRISINTEMQGFLFFSSPVLLLSLMIAIAQFGMAKANRTIKYLAIFSIKPVIVTPIWALLTSILTGIRFDTYAAGPIFTTQNEATILLSALPAIFYTLIAACCMRKTRQRNRVIFWLVLIVDAIRWMLPNATLMIVMASVSKNTPPLDYVGIWLIGCGITAAGALMMLVMSIVLASRRKQIWLTTN